MGTRDTDAGELGALIPWPDDEHFPNIPAEDALELFMGWCESRGLKLWPHQEEALLDLATGDLTFSSARIHDLEVHSPGVGRWLEASSVGNFSDFQARRSNIRVRDATRKTVPVHTLNGSALATPRVWAALLENGYQADGTVRVPEALVQYLGTDTLGVPRAH